MTLLEAIILGIVEGITEYLPISSTGHLILTKAALGLSGSEQESAIDAFIIVVQGGAILAVLGLYRERILQMIRGIFGKNQAGRKLFINLIIAFMPAVILGPLLDDKIEEYLFKPIPVIIALAGWGVVMILLGPWQRKIFNKKSENDQTKKHSFIDIENLTWRKALFIGLLQCVAMWPGTSRSMMTIVAGMFVGMKPKQAAEFSFLLALPTLGGACFYKGLKNIMGDEPNMFEVLGTTSFIAGTIAATIAAAISVKWLVSYLQRHGVAIFGWYRIALSVVFGVLLWQKVISL